MSRLLPLPAAAAFSLLLTALCALPAAGEDLTIDRIFSNPELDGATPILLKFSPNGKRLSFLQGKSDNYDVLDLYEYDLATGQPHLLVDSKSLKFGTLTEEEKARRERQRVTKSGIVDYSWSNDANQILFPANGELYLYREKQPLKKIGGFNDVLDPKFSPKDSYVSFVHTNNLYFTDLKTNRTLQVTKDGKGVISNGVAEFVAQEEMARFTGYWWSEDEKYLAFTRVDESPVELADRYEINDKTVTSKKERYPTAGTLNVKIKLGVVSVASVLKGAPSVTWIPLGANEDIYLARADWTEDGKLSFQIEPRDQKKLELFLYDPATKKKSLVLTETDPHWVNLSNDYHWLKKSPNLIWSSEKSGFEHFYLVDRSGKTLRQITKGDWQVDHFVGVDEEEQWVYFLATKKSPLEKHLYRAPIESEGEPELLTTDETFNDAELSKDGKVFVRSFSSSSQPKQASLHQANGKLISVLSKNEVNKDHPLYPFKSQFTEQEFGSFKGPSGDLIFYSLIKPPGFRPSRKYPLIVLGYGGPTGQEVAKRWDGKWALWRQVLAKKGFVVASFDNRGSPRRGKKFESALYHAMATVEVEDQVAGVKFLESKGFVDKDRVGFMGWSYGGYLSLMLKLKAPDVFAANVAVAPVTNFALYDTHYEERYMGKPQDDVDAYKRANVLEFAKFMKPRMLILHGMADDNVLFTHSTLLFKKLQEEGKIYESVLYPGAKHGISGKENQKHVFKTVTDFFERYLLRKE
jgi:dipeptidyl-peptidase 4